MEGQRLNRSFDSIEKIQVEDVDRDVSRPKLQPARFIDLMGRLLRQVAVLDDLQLPINLNHISDPFQRTDLVHHLRRQFGLAELMEPEQLGRGDLGQRIVDLAVIQRLDPEVFQVLKRATAFERRNHPSMPIGAKRQTMFRVEQ